LRLGQEASRRAARLAVLLLLGLHVLLVTTPSSSHTPTLTPSRFENSPVGFALAHPVGYEEEMMPTLELDASEARVLAEVLTDYVTDLRMEVANTDSMEVRDDHKSRETFLKDLVLRLGGRHDRPGGASPSPARP